VQPELERIEIEGAVSCNDDFAIENRAVGQLRAQRVEQLGKVAVKRLLVAALDQDLAAVAKDQRAKAVPLGLEDPALARRQRIDSFREHRQHRRIHGKIHALMLQRVSQI
jgi:hypothetical protein